MTCQHKPALGPGIFSYSPKDPLRLYLADDDPRSYDDCGYREANVCSLCGSVYLPSMIAKWKPIAPPISVGINSPHVRTYYQREQAMRARIGKTDMGDAARLRTLREAVVSGYILNRAQRDELKRLANDLEGDLVDADSDQAGTAARLEKIRSLRKDGWTLREIGSYLGVSQQAVHQLLRRTSNDERK